MENTGKVLFSEADEKPVWFVAVDGQNWIGPLAAAEVVDKISEGELTWAHFGWRQGQKDKNGKPEWRRLCDIPTFKAAVPLPPGKKMPVPTESRGAPPPVPPSAPKATQWFLFYSDSQFGPFGEEEVHRFLRIGKIHGEVHAWAEGMPGWQKLKTLETFDESVKESRSARETKSSAALKKKASGVQMERRKAPRFPLLARSILTAGGSAGGKVISGMCRDVSVGGMQLLTSEIPGPAGTRIKLNISAPPGATESSGGSIRSFVAEGVVVRELEDGRGFSFRFENLSAEGRKAIEAYVSQQA